MASDRFKGAHQLSELASDSSVVKSTNESDLINLSMENVHINEEKQFNLISDNEYTRVEESIGTKEKQLLDVENNSNLSSVNAIPIFNQPVGNLLEDLTDSTSFVEREIFPADILLHPHGNLDVLVSTD